MFLIVHKEKFSIFCSFIGQAFVDQCSQVGKCTYLLTPPDDTVRISSSLWGKERWEITGAKREA